MTPDEIEALKRQAMEQKADGWFTLPIDDLLALCTLAYSAVPAAADNRRQAFYDQCGTGETPSTTAAAVVPFGWIRNETLQYISEHKKKINPRLRNFCFELGMEIMRKGEGVTIFTEDQVTRLCDQAKREAYAECIRALDGAGNLDGVHIIEAFAEKKT